VGVFEERYQCAMTVASVTEQNIKKSEKTKAAATKSIRSLQLHIPHHTP